MKLYKETRKKIHVRSLMKMKEVKKHQISPNPDPKILNHDAGKCPPDEA